MVRERISLRDISSSKIHTNKNAFDMLIKPIKRNKFNCSSTTWALPIRTVYDTMKEYRL